jgi:hypothetical protein
LRRRQAAQLQIAFDYEGIRSVDAIQVLIDLGIIESFKVEPAALRARLLFQGAGMALKAHAVGELEERIAALEAAKHQHQEPHRSVFDAESDDDPFPEEG